MNRTPNPKLIGAFVSLTLILLVCMVMYFGTANFLNRSTQFILFFDQSVNGLNVGSPVKFRGVPVGQVERIMIRVEGQAEGSTAIPVIIEINQSRLERELGVSVAAFQPESIHESIDRGLVGQLSIESFITGQLFVEFSFEADRIGKSSYHLEQPKGILEIPTLNSSLDQITADIAQIISDLGALDLQELTENINEVLVDTSAVLDGIDSEAISASMTGAADEFTAFLQSDEFKASIRGIRSTFEEIEATAKSFNVEDGAIAETIDTWTVQVTETLDGLDRLTGEASELLEPDSDLRYEFENMLRELGRAARSVRLLSEYLERNPNALLTGRSEEE